MADHEHLQQADQQQPSLQPVKQQHQTATPRDSKKPLSEEADSSSTPSVVFTDFAMI